MAGDIGTLVLFLLGLAVLAAAVILLERYLHAAFWAGGAPGAKARKLVFLVGYLLFGTLGYSFAAPLFAALHSVLEPDLYQYSLSGPFLGLLYGFSIGSTLFLFGHAALRKLLHVHGP